MDNTTSPSPSSPERGSLGVGDLASKYTRLASEYSKVRAQLGVLKKAVIEEKNSKENVAELLKENETKTRKLEAEMDALNFRNSQNVVLPDLQKYACFEKFRCFSYML